VQDLKRGGRETIPRLRLCLLNEKLSFVLLCNECPIHTCIQCKSTVKTLYSCSRDVSVDTRKSQHVLASEL